MHQHLEELRHDGDNLTYDFGGWEARSGATRALAVVAGLLFGLGVHQVSAALVVLAAAMAFLAWLTTRAQARVTIDAAARTMTLCRGLPAAATCSRRSLAGATALRLAPVVRRDGRGLLHRWFVLVTDGDDVVELGARTSRRAMHNIAEKLAVHLNLPFVDVCRPAPTVSSAYTPAARPCIASWFRHRVSRPPT